MQVKLTERALRDLFNDFRDRGKFDLAAGVYLAARKLGLITAAWHLGPDVVRRVREAEAPKPALPRKACPALLARGHDEATCPRCAEMRMAPA